MPCKKRASDKKKVPAKVRQPEKAVTIVKHFDRKIAYNNDRAGSPKIPEVNANIDRIENLKDSKEPRRWPPKDRSVIKTHISLRPQIADVLNNIRRPSADRAKPQLKSKSCGERTFDRSGSVPPPPAKSKSLECPVVKRSTFRRYKSLVKHSSSSSENDHANNLKREILTNRSEPSGISSNRRERVDHIRKEIRELVGRGVDKKRAHVAELMTEIAEFRKTDVVVYDSHGGHRKSANERRGRTPTPTPAPEEPKGPSLKGSSETSSEAEAYR